MVSGSLDMLAPPNPPRAQWIARWEALEMATSEAPGLAA